MGFEFLILFGGVIFLFFGGIFAFATRYKKCPPDRILVVSGKVGKGGAAQCHHGGAAFVWPIFQDYQFLELTPIAIEINLAGALSKQNIRINTPSTFTVGISTEPGVMGNAAERLLGQTHAQIKEIARDIIFGQMRVVIATLDIEEINADRDKLIANIASGVETELKKVGLRLINVNIQDITDESGYIEALGREAAAHAINEAKIKVAQRNRDGEIGQAEAQRDQRIRVARAHATATEGENEAGITIANSNANRREKEAEAERLASAAEKVKSAQALQEAYGAEREAEQKRAEREQATQYANVVVPAEIDKQKVETMAEAEAERIRRTKKGEADGYLSVQKAEADAIRVKKEAEGDGIRAVGQGSADSERAMFMAQADGAKAILTKKAEGFKDLIDTCQGAENARVMLVTEYLPKLVEEQVRAISNLKIDQVTVWDRGRDADGRTSTADWVSGMVSALPPLHDLAKNVGLELPDFMGRPKEGGPPAPPPAGEK